MYILSAVIETAQLTIRKIRKMLELKEAYDQSMKKLLGASFNYELLQLMFALPYLKIEILESKGLAHRQTASTWLKKLAEADILTPEKKGRTKYFINHKLVELLSTD
jgi:Fic family protein